jgi:hypothetical protein
MFNGKRIKSLFKPELFKGINFLKAANLLTFRAVNFQKVVTVNVQCR